MKYTHYPLYFSYKNEQYVSEILSDVKSPNANASLICFLYC